MWVVPRNQNFVPSASYSTGDFLLKVFSMDRPLGACTLMGMDIRESNTNEHKSYTNISEWSDMRIVVAIARAHSTEQLAFINKK